VAATNRYMNVSSCSFTPSGGSLTAIKGVQSVSFDEGGGAVKFAGDTDLFPRVHVVNELEPTVTLEIQDAGFGLITITAGQVGSLTFTINDALNGSTASGGAKIFVLSNAVLLPRKVNQAFRQPGVMSLTFGSYASDGVTNPMAVTAA